MNYKELTKVADSVDGADYQLYWKKNLDTNRNPHVSEYLYLRTGDGLEGKVGKLWWNSSRTERGTDSYSYEGWIDSLVFGQKVSYSSGRCNSKERAKELSEEWVKAHSDEVINRLAKTKKK